VPAVKNRLEEEERIPRQGKVDELMGWRGGEIDAIELVN
jgi:hypothetical protein